MKRVIAVSDVHGDIDGLRETLALAGRNGKIDAVVFLGDGMREFDQVREELQQRGIACYAVAGNNDWSTHEPQETVFAIGGVRFYACHGHTRYVKYGLERLWFAAREREAQVVLYGHTHSADIEIEYGMFMINPGAVCDRRVKRSAYAEIRVEDNGAVLPQLIRW
ncbi:MAG: YfcE family phosphodiesterase [Clostridia bacterium]|nr:YfcE family phosphodiesterase [Clostridia bacterium]